VETNGEVSKITDITEYEQEGTVFSANDVHRACVLECNYVKDGTVHKLTTPNTASENIKFFATAAFDRGDTFTFNGEVVTAQTTSGHALDKNFFKANAIVECRKRGNVLYFASSSKSIVDDSTGAAYRLGIENGIMYIEEE
jgi:hypothetical protein